MADDTPAGITSLTDYRLLGNSGLRVSPICLGTMTFGKAWDMGAEDEECRKVYDLYRSKGGNFFDTANLYQMGHSESLLGQYISGARSECVVATKYTLSLELQKGGEGWINPNAGGNSRASLRRNLHESLRRLGTDYVDVLYVHAWTYKTPVEEVMRALDDVVRNGDALYIGISDTPAWVVSEAQTYAKHNSMTPFVALQTRYNLLDRSMEGALWPMANKHGLATVPWGVLAEGFLTGKYDREAEVPAGGRSTRITTHMADDKNWAILDVVKEVATELDRTPVEVAVNWYVKHGITSPLIGARNETQLAGSLSGLDFEMSDEQHQRIADASAPDLPFPFNFNAAPFYTAGAKIETPAVFEQFSHIQS